MTKTTLTKSQIRQYRWCFLNGFMDNNYIVAETGLPESTIYGILYNKVYKDEQYQKSLNKAKLETKIPFTLPIRRGYNEQVKRILSNYNIPTEIRVGCLKNNVHKITYDDQTALFIIDNDGSRCLLIIENNISKKTGYFLPHGKYKIELLVDENREYFSKFIYNKEDGNRAALIANHDNYWITDDGKVISIKSGKVMTNAFNLKGYPQIVIPDNNGVKCCYRLHRLVATAFIPNTECKDQVNHIDGVKTNNHYTNLEWCTNTENQRHARSTGLLVTKYNEEAGAAKLTNEQVKSIRLAHNNKEKTISQLADMYNVTDTAIRYILQYITYPTATDPTEIPRHITSNREDLKGENSSRGLFTNNEVKQMRLDYMNKRYSISELAIIHNISHTTVCRILGYKCYKDASDISEIPPYIMKDKLEITGENSVNAKITDEQAKEIRILFRDKVNSISELSRIYGVDPSTITRILTYTTFKNASNINEIPAYRMTNKDNLKGINAPRTKITPDIVTKLKTMRSEGKYTHEQLCDIFKLSRSTIHKALNDKSYLSS